MKAFSLTHFVFLAVTFAFFAGGCVFVKKLKPKWQNFVFLLCAVICAGGIVYRYGFGFFNRGFSLKTLALQMLQVCNFNLILVILMLIPKCEMARQYSVFFSAICAFTTFVSIPKDWAGRAWYDIYVINSWLNHTFAIALPLFMVSAKRLKPKKEYIWRVVLCVFLYFTVVYGISEILIANNVIKVANSFSFIYRTEGVGLLQFLNKLIPLPYFYLYPLLPLLIAFFYALAWAFKNYTCGEFCNGTKNSKEKGL